MIVNLVAGVQVGVASAVLSLTHAAHAEDFVWQHSGIRIGRLAVPAGFKVENYDCREGIVTRLVYQDGSRITLQSGGMYGLPLFKGAEYILVSTEELPAKTIRVGRAANGTTAGERTTTSRRRQTENESACWRYSRRTSGDSRVPSCAPVGL